MNKITESLRQHSRWEPKAYIWEQDSLRQWKIMRVLLRSEQLLRSKAKK